MRFARHWAIGQATLRDSRGEAQRFEAWGWSDQSPAEAQTRGAERARRLGKAVLAGRIRERYPYGGGDRPLREELLEEIPSAEGDAPSAALTRNSYGVAVLNAARAMFVDIDAPPPEPRSWSLLDLFRRAPRPDPEQILAAWETEATARIEAWIAATPGSALRLYRTRAGLRALVTHAPIDPLSDRAKAALEAMGADPLYRRLCESQRSFRARLTPKPWRCGVAPPYPTWPARDAAHAAALTRWVEAYEARADRYAVCRLRGVFGSGAVAPEIAPLLALHDRRTRVASDLPLA